MVICYQDLVVTLWPALAARELCLHIHATRKWSSILRHLVDSFKGWKGLKSGVCERSWVHEDESSTSRILRM